MNYIAWNNALGAYFFNPANADRKVTLYLDRNIIDLIGKENSLGTWEDMLEAACHPPSTSFSIVPPTIQQPLQVAFNLMKIWKQGKGAINNTPMNRLDHPPVLLGIALLILAWTEHQGNASDRYYDRLKAFIDSFFPFPLAFKDHTLNTQARKLISTLPEIKNWYHTRHGTQHGILAIDRKSEHRYVGAILFHAFIDTRERDLLPALWTTLKLPQGQGYTSTQLLELIRRTHHFSKHFPNLSISLVHPQLELRKLAEEILHNAYLNWNGTTSAFPPHVSTRTLPNPQIWIGFKDNEPARVCIDNLPHQTQLAYGDTPLWIDRPLGASIGVLREMSTNQPVKPDKDWMFGAITLSNEVLTIKRSPREHFWLWPASCIGHTVTGFLEGTDFLPEIAFNVVAQGTSIPKLQAWIQEPRACSSPQKHDLPSDTILITGHSPAYNPFDHKSRLPFQLDNPTITLKGGIKLQAGVYLSEFPPTIQSPWPPIPSAQVEVLPLEEKQQPLTIIHDPTETNILVLHQPPALGEFRIAYQDVYQVHNTVNITFQLAPTPILQQDFIPPTAFDAQGQSIFPQEGTNVPSHFWHNRLFPEPPAPRPSSKRFKIACRPKPYAPPQEFNLGHLLAAKVHDQESTIPLHTFYALAIDHAAALGLAPASKDIDFLPHMMQSLGFFHYFPESPSLHLSPVQLVRLPDHGYAIQALLLGLPTFGLTNYLHEWNQHSNPGIDFHWIYQSSPLIPPILQLSTFEARYLDTFVADLNSRFPNVLLQPAQHSLSEALLEWLAPLPHPLENQNTTLYISTTFPAHEKHWDTAKNAFVTDDSPPVFPTITRSEDIYNQMWHCTWWASQSEGYPVNHQHAIHHLYTPAAHNRPFLIFNKDRPDELLIPGRYRFPHLLERALVLATGHLPDHITIEHLPQLQDQFAPKAHFRIFKGIKPAMRIQIARILNFSDPSSPDHFTPTQII